MPDLLEQFENDSAPTDMRPFQDWDRFLEEGETVLWEGFEAPFGSTGNWNKHHRTSAYVVVLSGVIIGLSLSPIGWIVAGIGALLWIVSSPLMPKHDKTFAYAVSDRHAFVHQRNARKRHMKIAHTEIDKIIVIEGERDQVYFGQKPVDASMPSTSRMPWGALPPATPRERFGGVVSALTSTTDIKDATKVLIGFYNIPDGHEAAKLLTQARELA